jgi:hypothetical protein
MDYKFILDKVRYYGIIAFLWAFGSAIALIFWFYFGVVLAFIMHPAMATLFATAGGIATLVTALRTVFDE